MILIGDDLVPFETIQTINKIDEIKNTSSNATIVFDYKEDILKYCFEQKVPSAVIVTSIKEAIYSNALSARYIIASKELASSLQKVAENYMFDSKILSVIESSNELEDVALMEIDGVIYKKIICKSY